MQIQKREITGLAFFIKKYIYSLKNYVRKVLNNDERDVFNNKINANAKAKKKNYKKTKYQIPVSFSRYDFKKRKKYLIH